jgi:ketosteroid isomerase-like protein
MANEITPAFLDAFGDAFNRHDAEAILKMMTDDCVFESYAGPDAGGTRFGGPDQVRAGVTRIWTVCPDAYFGKARHFICGDRGVSEWVFTGTQNGQRIEVNGCDIFSFRDGKIAVRNAFRKNRTTT